MEGQPFKLRWGIIGAGNISRKFVRDLLIDPHTRGVWDIAHRVLAIGSRSLAKAQKFIQEVDGLASQPEPVKAYGSYQELIDDPEVDVVYIATPHSLHYQDVKLCFQSNKNVLCEKPLTVNAAQAKALAELARKKKCFLMEALWTRFLPITYSFQGVVASGEIGEIERVDADYGINFHPDSCSPDHRLVNPDLAGGALLDLGPYAWTMLALTLLHQHIKPHSSPFFTGAGEAGNSDSQLELPKIKASGVLYKHPHAGPDSSAVDGSNIVTLEFPTPSGRVAQGLSISSFFQTTHAERGVTIYGSKGRIKVESPACCPEKFVVTKFADGSDDVVSEKSYCYPIPAHATGYVWEADEVGRCIRDGRLESERMPLSESVLMLEVFDAIRSQTGVVYPDPVEARVKV